jgi:Xaa-Pro aminopeptidase
MIAAEEFSSRRKNVLIYMQEIGLEKLILASGVLKNFSNDVFYPFRADSDFYYLTGLTESDNYLILEPAASEPETLIIKEVDEKHLIWEGERYSLEQAKAISGAQHAKSWVNISADQKTALQNYADEFAEIMTAKVATRSKAKVPDHLTAEIKVIDFIHKLRTIKSEAELELMKKSSDIAVQAHNFIANLVEAGAYEYELEAQLNNIFRAKGASGWAYPAIVASGASACVLHYIKNDQQIKDGDLVLVDAGCEYQMYASDITRAYAAAGQRLSARQQDLYDLVLETQQACIENMKPGNTLESTHDLALVKLGEGLKELKMISDAYDLKQIQKYYMHGIGHSLGIDVHDPGLKRETDKYLPGMVLTVEPGLYDREHGIGIRIEDNIVITKAGNRNLTDALRK